MTTVRPPATSPASNEITLVEAMVYIVLTEATRPLTTMEIAAALRRPFTTIRRRTHALTEDGLLERHRDPTDGRRLRYAVPE